MDKALIEEYMRELQSGNLDALDGLYVQTSRSIYLLAFSILRNGERAKDIMQDTFLRVAANIDKYKLNTNAVAWILKISRNLSYREYANGNRNVSLEVFGDSLQDDKSLADFWTGEIDLNIAMARLSAAEREVVTLFSLEGYKHREIAAILGKPLGTVLWMYNKALKKLKKAIESQ